VIVPGGQVTEKPNVDDNQNTRPLAQNRIQAADRGYQSLQELFAAAEKEGKDTTPCEHLLELAEEYLQRAQENYEKGNFIAANYWALQATTLLEEAEECLKQL
jgi:hypothetical protein